MFIYLKFVLHRQTFDADYTLVSRAHTPKVPAKVENGIFFAAILPYREEASPQTREFLARVVDVLLDYVQKVNDRNEKVS